MRKCGICLLTEAEVAPKLRKIGIEAEILPHLGFLELVLKKEEDEEMVKEKFQGFFFGQGSIQESLHKEMVLRKKKLALAESCTGGSVAAKLTSLAGASDYFLGSIVAYSNRWKEHFLQVSRTSIEQKGAVSKEVVVEMIKGLFHETEADFVAAISGIAGPGGGSEGKPVGTIFIGIGVRGDRIDVGQIQGGEKREENIELASFVTIGALWRRLVHNAVTFL